MHILFIQISSTCCIADQLCIRSKVAARPRSVAFVSIKKKNSNITDFRWLLADSFGQDHMQKQLCHGPEGHVSVRVKVVLLFHY